MLETHHAGWFNAAFAFTGANWFVLLICAPVTFILFGGYLISTHMPARKFAVWWAALYAATEGVLKFVLWFFNGANFLTIVAAVLGLALIGLALGIAPRLLAGRANTVLNPAPLEDRQRLIRTALFVATTTIYGVILSNQAGPLPVSINVGSMTGGLIDWWITTSRVPADPSWSVRLMLALLTFFYTHVGKEALTNSTA